MTGQTRTRFAPSPTGYLHLGNARTALYNALWARKQGGQFILRIEDTDQNRSEPRYVTALQEDLRWLGLQWQEGPEVTGEYGPYCQSERAETYAHYFEQLATAGRVYPCFCSEQELALSRKRQRASGQAPRYAGTCAHLSEAEQQQRLEQGRQPTLRFRVPQGPAVEFQDQVRGRQRFVLSDIGDFIVRRADGSAAFFFSNALDDALMRISHVLRGEDHLSNTPRQILILQALALPIPEYGHISMLVGYDGAPLSKRHGSLQVRTLREEGYLALAVLNQLARLGHSYEVEGFRDVQHLADDFTLSRLGKASARYETSQLKYWQRQAVEKAEPAVLRDWCGDALLASIPAESVDTFLQLVRGELSSKAEIERWLRILFDDSGLPDDEALAIITDTEGDFFQLALASHAEFQGDFRAWAKHLKTHSGRKGKALFQPLRAALTGVTHGPEMAVLCTLLPLPLLQQRLLWASKKGRANADL